MRTFFQSDILIKETNVSPGYSTNFCPPVLLQAAADPGDSNKRPVTPHPHAVLHNLRNLILSVGGRVAACQSQNCVGYALLARELKLDL
jgi:hypothetical protein